MDAQTRFDHIFNGPGKETISFQKASSYGKPLWYDPSLMEHAHRLYDIYSFVLSRSSTYGLIFGLSYPEAYIPLVSTGNSSNISCLFSRYLSTALHLKAWYQNDLFDQSSLAYKSIKTVRGYHRQISSKTNKNINPEKFISGVWLSQADFCLTQWAFVGFFTVFPQHLGGQTWTDEDFKAFFHFWRVIGHCMGLEDQYNLCTEDVQHTRELCRIIFQQNRYKFQNPKLPEGSRMGDAIGLALRTSPGIIRKYSCHFFDKNPDSVELETFGERIDYFVYDFILHRLSHFVFLMWILTQFYHFALYFAASYTDKIQCKLGQMFKGQEYKFPALSQCPFQTRLNYRPFQKTFM